MTSREQRDIAGRGYWNELWTDADETVDAGEATPVKYFVEQQFADFFAAELARFERGSRLLELGCANSLWLPHFARVLGFDVAGIDYSERGCELERAVLARAGVEGDVVCADLFDPPARLVRAFDVVVSFGVVEHFADTAGAIQAFETFLADGGRMITVIPNVRGAIGLVQRLLNPDILAIHVPLGPEELEAAHRVSGIVNVRARYFSSTNFGVLNMHGVDPSRRSTAAKELTRKSLVRFSRAVWALEKHVPLPATGFLSGYVVCVADRSVKPRQSATPQPA
jgi:SAM-dependent methyltransferase